MSLEATTPASPAPRGAAPEATAPLVPLDAAATRERCASPLFRRAVYAPGDATVHPARLASGCASA